MTDRERVSAIRQALKEKGYTSRRVGVSYHIAGLSAVIRVTIKEPNIDKGEIENLVKGFSEIDIDERTGEILEGGNTFVSVHYDYKLSA